MVEQTEKIKFFDPHFHIVDYSESGPHSQALWSQIYPSASYFGIKDYEALIIDDQTKDKIDLIGGMFMEATCVSQKRIDEALWVDKQLDKSDLPYGIISGVDLAADITETLEVNKKLARFRGFRNIMNWLDGAETNWPD